MNVNIIYCITSVYECKQSKPENDLTHKNYAVMADLK